MNTQFKAFKNLMAAGWNDLPNSLISEVNSARAKNSDDKAGKEVMANVFRAAEAIEEFGAIVMNLKTELDDAVGASGEVLLRAWIDNPMFSLSILSGSQLVFDILNLFVEYQALDKRVGKRNSYCGRKWRRSWEER